MIMIRHVGSRFAGVQMNSVLCFSVAFLALCAVTTMADLRQASQPNNQWKVLNRGSILFQPSPRSALYFEPSDFNYAGLKRQRDGGAYDQFLRSNIDM